MIIIKEPHTHKEASGSVTIIEEVSQSWSEGSGSVFAPLLFGLRRFGPGRFAPAILDLYVYPHPRTFWTWTFRGHDVSPPNFLDLDVSLLDVSDQSFRPLTFLVQDVSPPACLDLDVSPLDILDLDVLPPEILDQDISRPDSLDLDVSHPGSFATGRFGPGRFVPGRFWPGRFWPGRFVPYHFRPGRLAPW